MQLNNLVGAKSSYVLEVGLKKLRIAGKDVANLRVTSHVTISRDIATKCFPAMPSPFINKDAVVVEIDDERETAVLLYKHDAYWYIVNGTVELIEQPKVETGPAEQSADVVEIHQERQTRPGSVEVGSVPFRVMCKDWIFPDRWIVQYMLGPVTRMTTEEILACPVCEDQKLAVQAQATEETNERGKNDEGQ